MATVHTDFEHGSNLVDVIAHYDQVASNWEQAKKELCVGGKRFVLRDADDMYCKFNV